MTTKKRNHQPDDLIHWDYHKDLLFDTQTQAEFECLELLYACGHLPIVVTRIPAYQVSLVILDIIKSSKT